MAVKNLRAGNLDAVVTGGVDTNLYPGVLLAFKRLGILAETEPSLFDNDANGYVMGEGAACLVVTTYKYAKQNNMPVLGELKCLNMAASAPEHLLSPSENKYESVISNDTGTFKTRKTDLAYVITSYSIHYTKLYDCRSPRDGSGFSQWLVFQPGPGTGWIHQIHPDMPDRFFGF